MTSELKKSETKTVELRIPTSVPEGDVKLEKLDDGYRVKVVRSETKENEMGKASFSYSMVTEEHYGRKVKSANGGFNGQGVYEVKLDFEEGK